MSNTTLRLILAAAPRVTRAGGATPLPDRDAALLAWLALEGPTPRSRLATILWPGANAAAARNSLRQRLFKLRRLAGADLVHGQDTLALAPGLGHDLHDADNILGGLDTDIGGEFSAWLERQREYRRGRLRILLTELAEGAEAVRDWPDALTHARELLALEPLSEAAHRRVMRLHYLAGDRAAALLAFDHCEQVLRHEVNATPSPETLALLRTVQGAGVAPAPLPHSTVTVLRPPRLVGRQAEWRSLEQARAAGRTALLVAEAGLGKTRLAGDFAAAHGACMAGARPGDEGVAYASLSRLLRALPAIPLALHRELARLLPELGEAPPVMADAAARTRLLNAVAQAFRGLAIVFDDLHWADEASIDALRHAVGAGDAWWLLASRPAEGSAGALEWVDGWADDDRAVLLPLSPLSPREVAELLSQLGLSGVDAERDAGVLHRRTGGNPLFLLESLKAGWSAGDTTPATPSGVQALIARRIARLSPQAVNLARVAALAATDFSTELAAHVLGLRTIELSDPWSELESAQVLVEGAFAHDLVFEAARASVPAAVARRLHEEIALFLARHDGEPARLAEHWWLGGRAADAGAAWRQAAARARRAGRVLESAGLLGRAADAFAQTGHRALHFLTMAEQAQLLCEEQPDAAAQGLVERLAQLAQGDAEHLRAQELKLNLHAGRGDCQRVSDEGPQVLATARRHGDVDRELRVAIVVADALADLQRAREGVELLRPYAEAIVPRAAPDTQWEYWSALALSLDYADRLREALPAWDSARAVAVAQGRQDQLWKTIANRGSTLAKMGFVREAAEVYGQACAMAEAGGAPTLRSGQTRMVWAHRLRDSGQLADALALLEGCLELFTRGGLAVEAANCEHRLAQLFQQLGQPERALRLLGDARAGLPDRLLTVRLMHRADLAHDLGRDGEPLIREALALSPDPADPYHRMASLFATRLLPPAEGEEIAVGLASWARERERMGLALAAHVRAAACALCLGAPDRAAPHAEAALDLARRNLLPDSFWLPELWLVAGRVRATLGDVHAAHRLWQHGAGWLGETAQVPEPFRHSFMHRNAVNRELLHAARSACQA